MKVRFKFRPNPVVHFVAANTVVLCCGNPRRKLPLRSHNNFSVAVCRANVTRNLSSFREALLQSKTFSLGSLKVPFTSQAKALADGYTLVLSGVSQLAFNPALYKNLPYDQAKDFTYVSPVADSPFFLVTSTKSGIKTLSQFIEQAKKKDGNLTFSSAGIGNFTHIAMELIASQAGVKLLHVPYKGSAAALTAVLVRELTLW